jgi:putative transposase
LSKSIQDVSLYELVRQIEYKGNWYGRTVVKIGRFYPSSKACSNCGFINESLTLSDRSWVCPRCRVEHDRDFNAATNIYLEGKRTVGTTGLAGGEKCKTSVRKQFSVKPEAANSVAVVHDLPDKQNARLLYLMILRALREHPYEP